MTTAIAGEIIPSDTPGAIAMALREPVGVVLGLAPWSAPVILGVRAAAVPLACGDTVVLKGSEICPRTHRLIGEVFSAAGCGEGVDTEYGLSAAVFGRDVVSALAVARRIDSGICHINGPTLRDET